MVLFRNLDQKASGLLRQGFCHDKPWQVALNHSGDNPKFSALGSVSAANTLDGAPTIRYVANGVTVAASAGSTGAASVDVKYQFPKPQMADKKSRAAAVLDVISGLTLGTRLERRMIKSVASDSTEVSAELTNDFYHARGSFNPYSMNWGIMKCFTMDKLAGGNGSLVVGGELNGSGSDLGALKYTLGGAFTRSVAKPWTICLKAQPHGKMAFGKLTGSVYAANEKGHAVAAELQHSIPEQSTSVTLGGMMYLSPKKDTWVKAKILPDAQIATTLCHKFSDNLTGSFGCQFSSTSKTAEPLSYGMKLALTC